MCVVSTSTYAFFIKGTIYGLPCLLYNFCLLCLANFRQTSIYVKVVSHIFSIQSNQCFLFAMQKELSSIETSERSSAAQVSFCNRMLAQVQGGDSMLLLPIGGEYVTATQAAVTIPGACAACGLPLGGSDVVCVYTLACGDSYHALCFSGWVGSETHCANPSCKQSIPPIAQSILAQHGWLLLLPGSQANYLNLCKMFFLIKL